jgi:hypothetical protein
LKELAKERMLRGYPTQKFAEGEALELFAKKIGSNKETVRQAKTQKPILFLVSAI